MPNPKSKTSKSRRGMRRSHDAIEREISHKCKNCNSSMRPHRVCPSCGFYNGKLVIPSEA